MANRARARGGLRVLLSAPGGQRRDARLGRHQPGTAAACRWSLVGRSDVIVEERLDGSLWVAAGGLHRRLVKAPSVAPLLRARKLDRIEDLLPAAEPPA